MVQKAKLIFEKSQITWVAAMFMGSRIIFYLAGVRFATPFFDDGHMLPVYLLKSNLLESVFYMHHQPPLYSFVIGLVLKVSGDHYPFLLHAIFSVLGLLLVVALFRTMRLLGVPNPLAFGACTLWMLSPASIFFENFLFYTYPLAALLTISCWRLACFAQRPTLANGLFFFGMIALIALMRPIFHLLWVIATTGWVFWMEKGHRKTVLKAAAIPILLVLFFYGKNFYLYGSFSMHIWSGMQLHKMATLGVEDIDALVAAGKLSPYSSYNRFDYLHNYAPYVPEWRGQLPHAKVLADPEAFNDPRLILIDREFGKDALTIIRLRPWNYLGNVMKATAHFFYPTYQYIEHPMGVPNYEKWYSNILMGTWWKPYSFTTMLCAILMLGTLAWVLWQDLPFVQQMPAFQKETWVFLLFSVLYLSSVINLMEIWENMRTRLIVTPLSLIWWAAVMTYLSKKILLLTKSSKA